MMGETPQNAAAPRMWLLGAVTLSGTLGIHIFAPALALAAAVLHATAPDLQLSIGLYVLGLALGQLVHGPLADRYGRRPILPCGMLIFVIGGVATTVVTSAAALSIARFVQAFGGCAGLVLAQAIVRDMATDGVAASGMAKLNLVMIVGPGIGPVLGGFVTALLGLRERFP